jgi:hypothetical protein
MNLEAMLCDLVDDISLSISFEDLIKDPIELDGFYRNLASLHSYLPGRMQSAITANISQLYCIKCKTYAISTFNECGDGFCSNCYKVIESQGKCLCGSELKPETNACINCGNRLNITDINCMHYCINCIKLLINKSFTACNLCNLPFNFYDVFGTCGSCNTESYTLLKVCSDHYHCLNCCENDLCRLRCSQCNWDIDPKTLARLFCYLRPKCKICNRRKKRNSMLSQCTCSNNYCYTCIMDQVAAKCLCGANFDRETGNKLNEYKKSRERLFGNFEIILGEF